MKTTAYVSHHDCPRHDTGWGHPEHQGRLPAVARAVYRDMLTLFEPLLEVEGVPAAEEDLGLVHTPRYLERFRGVADASARAGHTLEMDGVPVSGASWDAAVAAVGSALTAADAVLRGEVRNAFCAVRPPGRGATADAPGEFSLLNTVAIAARHLRARRGVGRVLVVAWGIDPPRALADLLAADDGIDLIAIQQDPETIPGSHHGDSPRPAVPGAALPPGSDAERFATALRDAFARVGAERSPDFLLLSAGLDILAGDPLGGLAVEPDGVYDLTRIVREWADAHCGGRLVSVLEGGYAPQAMARAVVQHLRALAALPRA